MFYQLKIKEIKELFKDNRIITFYVKEKQGKVKLFVSFHDRFKKSPDGKPLTRRFHSRYMSRVTLNELVGKYKTNFTPQPNGVWEHK